MRVKILLLMTAMVIFGAVGKSDSNENRKNILKNKRLVVAMDTCDYNYFLYKGNPYGYQFELLELFAGYEEVTIDFRIVSDSLKFDMLSRGDIDLVVFSEGFDSLYSVFNKYDNICSSIPLDDAARSVWLTADDNMPLMLEINVWASGLKGDKIYSRIQTKYFSHEYRKNTGKISPYDDILKKYSSETGWDWRLTASIVRQESQFKPAAVSKSGAAGLMQLMPNTVRSFGVKNVYDPEDNIRGGMKLIAYLADIFEKKGVHKNDLTSFVLAAYNAGHGKIFYFMNETENLGLDRNKWGDVYSVIIRKSSNGTVYAKPKFSGQETLKFVDNVLKNYKHYQNFFPVAE